MVARMCKKFDGTGVVKIQCSEGVYTSLKLSQMPFPAEAGHVVDGYRYMILDSRQMGVDGQRYRVIWPEPTPGPGRKYRSSSFSLSGGHSNETLFVLAEFLRDQGVDFVGLANKHGNLFRAAGLSGSSLAYLARNIPHSPACHVDFGKDDLPEISGSSGRVVGDTPFDA
jgi:hypothetical protein